MIPSTNNKLFVSEDWKKIYQSFKNADFKSYDFDTLKRTMISYLQENFPEDFNDFIESSEYIALIDLIAFLGQNLSFRIDLNARENFLETAQRRDSILRLAQLISYNPKRNISASGLLKLTAISTTDSVYDSNGTNLANTVVSWNDNTNPDWYQQFINIINSSIQTTFGAPQDKKLIDNVSTEQYTFNNISNDVTLFSFTKSINGTSMGFEVVPCTIINSDSINELPPKPGNPLSFIYKNDNQGSGSSNTGFFLHFRQGNLGFSQFSLDNPVPNEIVGINIEGINDTDVWLWQLDKNGNYSINWTKVPAVSTLNNNVIYNSVNKNIRTLYAISSRENDQIDLNFADGTFGDLPKGEFVLFYRQSNGLSYTIKPDDLSGIIINVPYLNKNGQEHSLQLTLTLKYTVDSSSPAESNADIQLKAPQNYYLQNRMITGEDYNIGPLIAGSDILKIKSVNRLSSGISKYFEITDVTGNYSSTDIFASDGIIYTTNREKYFEFEFSNRNQVLSVIKNELASILTKSEIRNFYFDNYPRIDTGSNITWTEVNKTPGQSRGYLGNLFPVAVGTYSSNELRFFLPNSYIKFNAPVNYYFDNKNNLKLIVNSTIPAGGKTYIWAKVINVIGDGSNGGAGTLDDGTGPIIMSTRIPTGAVMVKIIPKFIDVLSTSVENEIANNCVSQRNFGLTINNNSRTWDIIVNSNLNLTSEFSLNDQSNFENLGVDASWLIAFLWDGKKYKVIYRTVEYIFESEKQTAFYIDNNSRNYDFYSKSVITDKIEILSINTAPNSNSMLGIDYQWQIDDSIVEDDGFVQPTRVKISLYDYVNGKQFNPDSFFDIVSPDTIGETGYKSNFVYFKKIPGFNQYEITDEDIIAYPTEKEFFNQNSNLNLVNDKALFYFYDPKLNIVKYWDKLSSSLVYTDNYFGRVGRHNIKFRYRHNSDTNKRIDPSKSNIIDIYILTKNYDTEYRSWVNGLIADEPLAPTGQTLKQKYFPALENIKAISDELIFHPVKYKILFGPKADFSLQATFKAVRNSNLVTSDNNLKTKILTAIEKFFSLDYWSFGQKFYFSELSTFVMNEMSAEITNFVIVPKKSQFGNLYEIPSASNEIFVNGTTINEISIIDSLTLAQLNVQSTGT